MKKLSVIFINVGISLLITAFLALMTDGTSRHGYEEAILFAFACGAAIVLQLAVNLCFAIYFFIKKDNEKGKMFLISMGILVLLALIPAYILGFLDWDA